jgi:phosphoserine phosphatase
MKVKLILCDFDGTITQTDVLDRMCAVAGRENESREINARYQQGLEDGAQALIRRFSLLEGLSLDRLMPVLQTVELTKGARELFGYAHEQGIRVLVLSGNARFVLEYFGEMLHFSSVAGSRVLIKDGIIQPWDEEQCACVDKLSEARRYIRQLGLNKEEIVAIGDSIADEGIFALAGISFLINRKGNIRADVEIEDLADVIPYLNKE